MKMIDMNKKYRFRDGTPATVLATNVKSSNSVVVVRHNISGEDNVILLNVMGKVYKDITNHPYDLIEINPYEDFKIDDRVMVSLNGVLWGKRHFAGINQDGKPTTFSDGRSSWGSSTTSIIVWDFCRRPTPEELKGA